MSIDQIRQRIPGFVSALEEDRYRVSVGESSWPPLESRYGSAHDLFSVARITDIQRVLAGAAGEDERHARVVLEFVACGHAAAAAAPGLEERLRWERTGAVETENFSGTLASLLDAIAETPDPESRGLLEEDYLGELEDHRYLADEVLARHREGIAELGYGSHVGTLEILSGLDLRSIGREGSAFLTESRDLYDELLGWYLPRLTQRRLGEATDADLRKLERAAPLDGDWGGGAAYDTLLDSLRGIGLDPGAEGRLQLEKRRGLPGSAATCHAVSIPQLVRLPYTTAPGRPAWSSFLEALGEGLHHACTDATLPIEQRFLGDTSVPAASGALFASLLGTGSLASRIFAMPPGRARESARFEALLRLVHLRRTIGVLLLSLAVHEGEGSPEDAVETLGAATGVRVDSRRGVWSVETDLAAARRIRAAQLGAIHADLMRNRFDEDWFRNPAAGGYLRDLFSNGRRYTAQELAVQLGAGGLGYGPLLEEIRNLAGQT